MHKTVPNKISSVIYTKQSSNHTFDPTHNVFPQSYIICIKIGFSNSKPTAVGSTCGVYAVFYQQYMTTNRNSCQRLGFLLENQYYCVCIVLFLYLYECLRIYGAYFLCFGSEFWNLKNEQMVQDAQLHDKKKPHSDTKFIIIINSEHC